MPARAIGLVVMPDHVHLLVQLLGDTRVSELMTRFKWNAGKSIRELRGPRRVWEERFYDRTIRGEDELASAMRYIDWKSVRAGLSIRRFGQVCSQAERTVKGSIQYRSVCLSGDRFTAPTGLRQEP